MPKYLTEIFQIILLLTRFVIFKMDHPRHLFSFIFVILRKHYNICTKYQSSLRCWDLNPWPSEHESPPISTRPELPSICFSIHITEIFSSSTLYKQLVQWYREMNWPWDWEETLLGLRYSLTGLLLFAAFVSLVFTFISGPPRKSNPEL